MTSARALLVRHGQSMWNAEGRWQGQADASLSALGERQAREAASAVARLAPARVVTSDLARALRTAELVTPPGTELRIDERWREREAGAWTGLTHVEIEEQFPGWLGAHRSPPGFEADDALLARVRPALAEELREGGAVLVITHGGVIRTLERDLHAPSEPVPNLGGRWFHAGAGGVALGDRDVLIDPETVTVPEQI